MTGQTFVYGRWAWDVDAALALVEQHPRPVEYVPVEPLGKLLGFLRVDWDHAETVDTEEPILLAPFPDAPQYVLPIDGWHRVAKAWRGDLDRLPAYRLTAAEADSLRVEHSPRRRAR